MWHLKIKEILESLNLTPTLTDPSCFCNSNGTLILALYVDDGLIIGEKLDQVNQLLDLLNKQLDIKSGSGGKYIGLQVKMTEDGVTVSQSTYIKRVIERFNMGSAKKLPIPADPSLYARLNEVTNEQETFPYREAIQHLIDSKYRRQFNI